MTALSQNHTATKERSPAMRFKSSAQSKLIKLIVTVPCLFYFLFPLCTQAKDLATADSYDGCNWKVTYRGKVYDLAPLTRESLARPIESDIRYAMQRVPAADKRLQQMSGHLEEAKGHTAIASAFLGAVILSQAWRSREKNKDAANEINLLSFVAGAFFLKATFESWRSTTLAREDLVESVNSFNQESPHKIEPLKESINRRN